MNDYSRKLILTGPQILQLPGKDSRGSRYRGVAKNGVKWQVMIVKGSMRWYFGTILSEEQAAKIYDKYAIALWGTDAKTNFDYTCEQALALLNSEDQILKKRNKKEFDK